jgi:EGF-like domain
MSLLWPTFGSNGLSGYIQITHNLFLFLLLLLTIGDHCENAYDACRLDPCNGGTCVNTGINDVRATGYTCINCKSGYELSSNGTKCTG